MKAQIGLATAAILTLVAGGIKAGLPVALTVPEPAEGTTSQVRVTAVVDGDTIRVETLAGRQLGRVRLLGIDAPEVAHTSELAECYSEEATDMLAYLAPPGSTVELVKDTAQPNRDSYERLLRYVDHNDVDVALELLTNGAVRRYAAEQPLARGASYSEAIHGAEGASRGLWATC